MLVRDLFRFEVRAYNLLFIKDVSRREKYSKGRLVTSVVHLCSVGCKKQGEYLLAKENFSG